MSASPSRAVCLSLAAALVLAAAVPAGAQAKRTQLVGEPCQRDQGIAEHVLAVTCELLTAQRGDRSFLDEIA